MNISLYQYDTVQAMSEPPLANLIPRVKDFECKTTKEKTIRFILEKFHNVNRLRSQWQQYGLRPLGYDWRMVDVRCDVK